MKIQHGCWFLALVIAMNLAWIALPALAGEKQTPEGRVAVVNGSLITQADFVRAMDRVQRRLTGAGKSLDDSQLLVIRKEVLEGLINAELLYQESQRDGIEVEQGAIDKQLKTLKGRFPNEDIFKSALTKADLSEADLRSEIGRGLAIQQFITKEFVERVAVSTKEVRAYYDGHPQDFKQPEQVRASHILVKNNRHADESQRAEAGEKIRQIQQKLQEGEDFASLAKAFSQCPSSAKGGDLGYFRRGQMVKPFEDVAFALEPGEVSDPVETKFGYHLIKVTDKKPEKTIPYEDIKESIEQYLKDKKTEKEVSIYVQRLKENAKVERFLAETPK
jgi:peptidyl-prolyl cis-trans isomerase C